MFEELKILFRKVVEFLNLCKVLDFVIFSIFKESQINTLQTHLDCQATL
jgi:hypothetical protein